MMREMRLPMRLQIRARLTSGKLPTWPHLLPTTCFDNDSIVGNADEGDAMRLQIWTRLTSWYYQLLKVTHLASPAADNLLSFSSKISS